MVGRELTNLYPPKSNVPGDVLLEVDDLSAEYSKLRDVSFKAHRGEIIGVAGLDGSGQDRASRKYFTVRRHEGAARMTLDGKRIKNSKRKGIDKKRFCTSHRGKTRDGNFRYSEYP